MLGQNIKCQSFRRLLVYSLQKIHLRNIARSDVMGLQKFFSKIVEQTTNAMELTSK